MRKIVGVTALLALVACVVRPLHAASLGFETGASYYQARDSRYQGVGTDVALNFKLDDNLTMGYRVEEMSLRGDGTATAGTTITNSDLTFQGITAFYKAFTADESKLVGQAGLWMGSATSSAIDAATPPTGLTSPFVEPEFTLGYHTDGKVTTEAKFGLGYRFVRNVSDATPFGAGSSPLKDLDGLDINVSIGLMF